MTNIQRPTQLAQAAHEHIPSTTPVKSSTDDHLRRLPQMLGIKWVQDCLGISRAGIYRRLADGSMMPPIKIGSTNRWPKDYIRRVMERGFDPPGTYGSWSNHEPSNDDDGGAPAAP